MRYFYLICIALLSLSGCELYQSEARQCFQNPNKPGCERLRSSLFPDPSQKIEDRAMRHCMFNQWDVGPIRVHSKSSVEGLKRWHNDGFLNVEVSAGEGRYNCVFSPADIKESVYIPMTYELIAWLLRHRK